MAPTTSVSLGKSAQVLTLNLAPGLRVGRSGTAVGKQNSRTGITGGNNRASTASLLVRRGGFYYDYGAFQDVQIKAMGADAEMPTPGTQFLGILKSGSDQFHGSDCWESPSLQADASPMTWGRVQGCNSLKGQCGKLRLPLAEPGFGRRPGDHGVLGY
jgi:hypothetical protein